MKTKDKSIRIANFKDLIYIANCGCFGDYNTKHSCPKFVRAGNIYCIWCKSVNKDKRFTRK